MKRREFVGVAVTCIVSGYLDEWLIVADTRPNLNNRRYSAENLRTMAQAAKGLPVAGVGHLDVENVPLDSLRGVCQDARVVGSELHCRFRWFGSAPRGLTVTPSGMGILEHGADGFDQIAPDYRLTSFALNQYSAFESATAVGR